MLNGITLLSAEEKEELVLFQSLQSSQNHVFYDGDVMWRLGELNIKMKLPGLAHMYFTNAVKYHIDCLKEHPHEIDSWNFLKQRYTDGIGVAANPQMAAICENNIAILRQQPSLDNRPLTLPEFKRLSPEEGSNFLAYYELKRQQSAPASPTQAATDLKPSSSKKSVSLS
ncbi:MAG: hypothetical protein JSR17_12760 [Proteobacteria bacterium]|nr:hypothetical protein [Pseudomonadota bacterium]